jgi:hypothetical protein
MAQPMVHRAGFSPLRAAAAADLILRLAPTSNSGQTVHRQPSREVTSLQSTGYDFDAVGIIKADHAELVRQFQRLVALPTADARERLWETLRFALELHVAVESEVFYPAFLDATENSLTHFVATVEHENIIAQIQDVSTTRPGSAEFQSRVHSLARVFTHHARELEKEGGMLQEALVSTMSRDAVGRQIISRKSRGIETGPSRAESHLGDQRV